MSEEVLHTWESEEDLLACLALDELPYVQQATFASMNERVEFGGDETVIYDTTIRDGRGEPIAFPIRLVSDTQVHIGKLNEFTRRVAAVVSEIPLGKTMSYKEVATAAGSPRGYRNVGLALDLAFNSGWDTPWWRVIKTDGTIGTPPEWHQRELLNLEGHGFPMRPHEH